MSKISVIVPYYKGNKYLDMQLALIILMKLKWF